ncbi:MAG: hypothetical protein E6R03_05585 [Hyphomicrobiaceae bacterium]|nr:MAG: hypothetical protein E6R03_05585 [Hyphomicrobiaceae bacterium]
MDERDLIFNNGTGQLGPIDEKKQTLVIDERYAEDLKAKMAAMPPQPPIDDYSFRMGKADALNGCFKSIEEALFQLAPEFTDTEKNTMRPEWNHLVYFKDCIMVRLRRNVKIGE